MERCGSLPCCVYYYYIITILYTMNIHTYIICVYFIIPTLVYQINKEKNESSRERDENRKTKMNARIFSISSIFSYNNTDIHTNRVYGWICIVLFFVYNLQSYFSFIYPSIPLRRSPFSLLLYFTSMIHFFFLPKRNFFLDYLSCVVVGDIVLQAVCTFSYVFFVLFTYIIEMHGYIPIHTYIYAYSIFDDDDNNAKREEEQEEKTCWFPFWIEFKSKIHATSRTGENSE